jgi:hypothetical protein
MEKANWIRIAHITTNSQDPGTDSTIVKGVKNGVKLVLVRSIFSLVKLVIKAQAMVEELDSAKALADVSLEIVNQVASPEFFAPFQKVFGIPNPFDTGSSDKLISDSVGTMKSFVETIPSKEDIDALGTSLAKLIALRYTSDVIDPAKSGKIRLLWWATADSTDTLDLPFTEKADKTALTIPLPSSYWLGSTASASVPVVKPDQLVLDSASKSPTTLFQANDKRTASWSTSDPDDRDRIAKILGYNGYADFKTCCKAPGAQQDVTDEVALNRLWGVDLSDANTPKLAGLPEKASAPAAVQGASQG